MRIDDLMQSAKEWSTFGSTYGLEAASKYYSEAEGLIELLEIHDCGSVGGYDKRQPRTRYGFKGMEDRINWLKGKYK